MTNNIPNPGRELGWNDTIEHDSEYTLLPEGDYDFEVTRLERARHNGSAKLPACNKAVLTLRLTDGLHTGSVNHTDGADIQREYRWAEVNPLGNWTGGSDVDSGATNRKLGSDMGDSVTGGGLHGKSLCKADVSVNIYAWLKAQETGKPVELLCAIGDETVDGKPYGEIVRIARDYIRSIGGFEKFAEWGLIR